MERRSVTLFCIFLFAVLFAVSLIAGCTGKSTGTTPIERGEYLAMVGGCGDCHSPKSFTDAGPVPDATKLLSGYPANVKLPEIPNGVIGPARWGAITTNDMTAWVGPWGVSFSYNLTPHSKTGIGNWSAELFIQSLRTGKFMGTSRDMLPPMPWQQLGKMSDDDLKAIFAYLMSLPAIDNPVPEPIPPSQQ
jgi:mono/diheme cytochrome c family protein